MTKIMAIINVTPDSFSGDGAVDTAAAVERAAAALAQGADLLDIGGESTRPGAQSVREQEEIARVVPVVLAVCRRWPEVVVSVDTRKVGVAAAALDAGARMVNDVSGGEDPQMLALVARRQVAYVAMHNGAQIGDAASYQGVEQAGFWSEFIGAIGRIRQRALDAGVSPSHLVLDPGLGFGKTVTQNVLILQRLHQLPGPLLVGASHKAFIGALTGQPVEARAFGTAAVTAHCVRHQVAYVRVHHPAQARDVRAVTQALRDA